MSTCPKCGNYFTGWDCPTCLKVDAAARQTEAIERATKAAAKQARDAERVHQEDMEAQREAAEQERQRREEEADSRAWQAELAAEEQAERLERISQRELDEHRRIAEEATAEQERIAANGWRIEAQSKIVRGSELLDAGLVEDAILLLNDATRQDPGNLAGHLKLAVARSRAVDAAGSIDEFKKCAALLSRDFAFCRFREFAQALKASVELRPLTDLGTTISQLLARHGRSILEEIRLVRVQGADEECLGPLFDLRDAGFGASVQELVSQALELATADPDRSAVTYLTSLLVLVSKLGSNPSFLSRYREVLTAAIPNLAQAFTQNPELSADIQSSVVIEMGAFHAALKQSGLHDLAQALVAAILDRLARERTGGVSAEIERVSNLLSWITVHDPSADVAPVIETMHREVSRALEDGSRVFCAAAPRTVERKASFMRLFELAATRSRLAQAFASQPAEPRLDLASLPVWNALQVEDRHIMVEGWAGGSKDLEPRERQEIVRRIAPMIAAWKPAIAQDAQAVAQQEFLAYKFAPKAIAGKLGCSVGLVWLFTAVVTPLFVVGLKAIRVAEGLGLAVIALFLITPAVLTVLLMVLIPRREEARQSAERERVWSEIYQRAYNVEMGRYVTFGLELVRSPA